MLDSKESKRLHAAMLTLQTQLRQCVTQKKQLQMDISQLQLEIKELENIVKDDNDKLKVQLDETCKMLELKTQEKTQIEQEISSFNKKEKIHLNRQALERKLNSITSQIVETKRNISKLDQQIEQIRDEACQSLGKKQEKLRETLRSDLAKVDEMIAELKRSQFQLATKNNELVTEQDNLQQIINNDQKKIENSKAELKQHQEIKNNIVEKCKDLQEKICAHQQQKQYDSSLHTVLKEKYNAVLTRIRQVENEASKRNVQLEEFHVQCESKHNKIIEESKNKRDSIIKKQKEIREELKQVNVAYHEYLAEITKELDQRNLQEQQLSTSASEKIQLLQEDLSEKEKNWQQRISQGESEKVIELEREKEQHALNEFVKNELNRLSQQEKDDKSLRAHQISKEDSYLKEQATLENILQTLDEKLIELQAQEQQVLQSITSEQQTEDITISKNRNEAQQTMAALREELKLASEALTEYESTCSQSTQLNLVSELALLESEYKRLQAKESEINQKIVTLKPQIDELEDLLNAKAKQLENCSKQIKQNATQLDDIALKKIEIMKSKCKLQIDLKDLNLSDKQQNADNKNLNLLANETIVKNQQLNENLNSLENTRRELIRQSISLEQQLSEVKKQLDLIPEEIIDRKIFEALEIKNQNLTSEIDTHKQSIKKIKHQIGILDKPIDVKNSQPENQNVLRINEFSEKLQNKQHLLDNLDLEIVSLNDQHREIKSKLKKMNIDDKPKIEQPKDIVKQTENKKITEATDVDLVKNQHVQRKHAVDQAIKAMKAKHKHLMSKDQAVRAEVDEKIYQQIVNKVKSQSLTKQSQSPNYRTEEASYEDFLKVVDERKKKRGNSSSVDVELPQKNSIEYEKNSVINTTQRQNEIKTQIPADKKSENTLSTKELEEVSRSEPEAVKLAADLNTEFVAEDNLHSKTSDCTEINQTTTLKTSKLQKTKDAVKNFQEKLTSSDASLTVAQDPHKNKSESINKRAEVNDIDFIGSSRDAVLSERSKWGPVLMYSIIFFIAIAIVWAKLTVLDEITAAQGKVIPSSQIQVIQNLEGGILSELFVKEGDTVKKGQILLRIDDTRFSSSFKEGEQKYIALLGAISRLRAEATGADKIIFPRVVSEKAAEVVKNEQQLFDSQRDQIDSNTETLQKSYELAVEELSITKPLVQEGLMSQLELLRLKRQVNELQGEIDKAKDEFRSNAQKELNEKEANLLALKESQKAAEDRLTRTTVRSPVTGTVNVVHISTIGAVIQPGVSILEIVPTEDNLLIEAKVKPKDIAFIRPGQHAIVKVTAYDYTIYGGLDGTVEHISADTIEEEKNTKPDESYYKILVRTKKNYLGKTSKPLYIIPGMTVSVDVMTGKKSVLDYLQFTF